MRTTCFVSAVVCILMLVAGAAIAQTNLVADPGFNGSTIQDERPDHMSFKMGSPWTSNRRFWFTDIAFGWSAVYADGERSGKQTQWHPAVLAPGATGSIENVGGLLGQWNGEGSFYQNVAVTAGKTYRFSGYYWAVGDFSATTSAGQLWVNTGGGFAQYINTTWGSNAGNHPREQLVTPGNTDLTGATQLLNLISAPAGVTGANTVQPGWTAFSYDFTATSATIGLASRVYVGSSGTSATPHAWYMDNWSLVAVPEPGSLAALATGLIGLVGIIRRRK